MSRPSLNAAQEQAVAHRDGPMLVLAGAGSGKTRVLTVRLARLVDEHGVDPRHILAVTFTNKAAGEMKSRVATLLGREPGGLWIGTFHAICARLLRREAPLIGFSRNFTIYDEDDSEALLRRVIDDMGLPVKLYSARSVRHEISRAKNAMTSPEEYAATASDPYHTNVARVYAASVQSLRRANAMDFDDLLLHPLALLNSNPERHTWWRTRFRFLLVDEYQDTNRAQYLLLRALAGEAGNLFVVGDDDQSIYGWRGADLRNILEFQRDFPSAQLVRLEENYRSTRPILDAANAVIATNRERLGKTLRTVRQGGEQLTLARAADERDEAEWTVRQFLERARTGMHALDEMAVLVRTNSQTRAFEEVLRRSGVRYRVVGAVSFYERREVKDVLAYLRLLVNPEDDEAFLRAVGVPRRGIGDTSLVLLGAAAKQWGWSMGKTAAAAGRVPDLRPKARESLEQFAASLAAMREELGALQPAEALGGIIARIGYERWLLEEDESGPERMENVRELVSAAAAWSEEYGAEDDDESTPLERFLAQAALTTSAEVSEGEGGVTLMTLHAAKGLEFPVVAIAGLEEGLFPLSRADTPEAVEEERRLFYVGLTRAKDKLYLSYATSRRRGPSLMPCFPSHFLDHLPMSLVEERVTRPSWSVAREVPRRPMARRSAPLALAGDEPEERNDDAPAYRVGERVRHRRFGSGTVRQVTGRGRDLKVAVEFDDGDIGTKQLIAAYAGLEKEWE